MLPGKKYTPEDLLRIAWRGRWILFVSFVACALGALLVSRFSPNLYQSDTLIQVVPQRVPEEYVRATVTGRIEDRLQSLSQQVMSRTRLERIIQELNLYPEARQTGLMEDVVQQMRSRIKVDIARQADTFTVSFVAGDPRTAQRVTERLASLFIDENLRDRGNLAEATNDFLQSQLTDARRRLEEQEKRLEAFRTTYSGALPTQQQANMQAMHNTQLQVQAIVESINRDRDRRLMIERVYNDTKADLDAALAAPPPSIAMSPAGDPALPGGAPLTAAQQLEVAKASLAQLELRLKPEHPDVVRLKRRIEELERRAAAEALQQPLSPTGESGGRPVTAEQASQQRRLTEMRAEMESLDRQIVFKENEERRLRAVIANYQRRVDAVPGLESQWVALTRDYETLQKTYQELLAKSEDSKVAANLERRQIGQQFRVLDPARLPERPISPNRVQINLAGVALGLLLGVGLIALLEYRDTTLKSESDVVLTLSLPVLAVIPVSSTPAEQARRRRRRRLTSTAALVAIVAVTGTLFWTLGLWKYLT